MLFFFYHQEVITLQVRVSRGTQNTFSETWELKGLSSNIHLSGTFIYSSELVLQKHGVVLSGSFVLGLLAIPRDQFQFTFS